MKKLILLPILLFVCHTFAMKKGSKVGTLSRNGSFIVQRKKPTTGSLLSRYSSSRKNIVIEKIESPREDSRRAQESIKRIFASVPDGFFEGWARDRKDENKLIKVISDRSYEFTYFRADPSKKLLFTIIQRDYYTGDDDALLAIMVREKHKNCPIVDKNEAISRDYIINTCFPANEAAARLFGYIERKMINKDASFPVAMAPRIESMFDAMGWEFLFGTK